MGKRMKLLDLCNITTGKLDSNQFVAGGQYPFFTCAKDPVTIDSYAFDEDVILIAGNNASGNFHLNRFKGKFNAYQRTYVLTAKSGNNLDYVFYSLKLELQRLKERAQGSQTKFLTMPILNDIHIAQLDPKTQQRIASVLSAIDSKIDLNNRINAELEAMAKTLYDYWFVQYDFPDKNGKPYKSSGGKMAWNKELKREIPQGWSNGVASDLFIFNPSLSFPKNSIGSYIDMSALPTSGFMTDEVQIKAYNGGVKFQNGDVVIARITPCLENGKTGLITLLAKDEIGFGSTEFIVLRGKHQPLSSFAACFSRSELFRKFAIANMTGTSGRKRIEAKTLETFGMPLPPDSLLSKFEDAVLPFFQATTVNTLQNQQLSSLRDWLLPMLMNGQVKVR